METNHNKKGSSLLITVLIIAALASIAFGLSGLTIGETKFARDISKTLAAYYAADSGVECQMYNDRMLEEAICGNGEKVYLNGVSGIYYQVEVSGSYLSGSSRIIKSNGTNQDTIRTVRLKY